MEHATSADPLLPNVALATRRLHLDLAANPPEVSRARHGVVDLLARAGAPSTIVDDIELVVSELVSNAVVHGRPGPVHVEVAVDDEVVVAVANQGRSEGIPAVEEWMLPGPEAVSGRGLAIVRRLTDHVAVRQSGDMTVVVARRGLPGGGSPS